MTICHSHNVGFKYLVSITREEDSIHDRPDSHPHVTGFIPFGILNTDFSNTEKKSITPEIS